MNGWKNYLPVMIASLSWFGFIILASVPIGIAMFSVGPEPSELITRAIFLFKISLPFLWVALFTTYIQFSNEIKKDLAEKQTIRKNPWLRKPYSIRISNRLGASWSTYSDPLDVSKWLVLITIGLGDDRKYEYLTQAEASRLQSWLHQFDVEVRARKNFVK